MPVRIVQVGMGGWGQDWAAYAVPRAGAVVEMVAWVDADPTTLQAAQTRLNLPADRCFTALDDALAAVSAEAVLVTTPLIAHIPVTLAALNAGKHVLCEKPFAPSLAQAQQAVETAEAQGLTLMVSQNYRHQPAPRAVADLLKRETLGAVGAITIDFRRDNVASTNTRHLQLPDPLLIDMAIHHYDLLRMILGENPTSVACRSWNPRWSPFTFDASAVATIAFPSGIVASWRGSWVSPGEQTPWGGEWRVECADGEIQWRSRDERGGPTADHVIVRRRGESDTEIALPEVQPYGRAGVLTAFANAITSGTEPETSGRDNLGTLAFAKAMVESAANGGAMVTL